MPREERVGDVWKKKEGKPQNYADFILIIAVRGMRPEYLHIWRNDDYQVRCDWYNGFSDIYAYDHNVLED